MQRILTSLLLSAISFTLLSAQELKTPAPSPFGTVSQIVGLTEVTISYSRPGVKGRQVFGDLVPYGELWRTGANKSTTIKFSDDVSIEGKPVAAGEYALFTIPDQNEWTIIISPDIGPGSSKYKQENDIVRFTVQPAALRNPVERFTIEIADMTNNNARIVLSWANTRVSFAMTVDTDKKVMGQIDAVMKDSNLNDANIFYRASDYYFTNDKDLEQALSWADKAVELKPDAFWMSRLKSRIQAKMGDYKSAIQSAELSMKAAEKAGNDQYVRFNQEAIAEWEKEL